MLNNSAQGTIAFAGNDRASGQRKPGQFLMWGGTIQNGLKAGRKSRQGGGCTQVGQMASRPHKRFAKKRAKMGYIKEVLHLGRGRTSLKRNGHGKKQGPE